MQLIELQNKIQGELFTDTLHRIIYSTDASGYREEPLGVVYPKDSEDIRIIVSFAIQNHLNLIPRAGGTSLAGQVVGKGLVGYIQAHESYFGNPSGGKLDTYSTWGHIG